MRYKTPSVLITSGTDAGFRPRVWIEIDKGDMSDSEFRDFCHQNGWKITERDGRLSFAVGDSIDSCPVTVTVDGIPIQPRIPIDTHPETVA